MNNKNIPGFSDIPAGYFEQTKAALLKQVDENLHASPTRKNLRIKWKSAAVFLILTGLASLIFYWITPQQQTAYTEFTQSDNLQSVDTLKQQFVVSIDSLGRALSLPSESDSLLIDQLTDEDIIMYLIESEEFEF